MIQQTLKSSYTELMDNFLRGKCTIFCFVRIQTKGMNREMNIDFYDGFSVERQVS